MRRFELPSGTIDRGCSVPDLLAARLKAGTFSLDPERYDADLRAARMQGRAFALNVDLKDGRTIAVVNQPMPGGGWVASRCADPIFPIAPRSMSASFPRSDWHRFLMKALRCFAWNTNNWLYVLFAGAGSGCVPKWRITGSRKRRLPRPVPCSSRPPRQMLQWHDDHRLIVRAVRPRSLL